MKPAAKDLRICVASTGLGHVMRGVEGWAHDLGHALASRGNDVLLCKGDGVAESAYERVVSCWTRRSDATERLLRWLPNSLGWRFGLGNAYSVEQTTFALNLISLLRRERINLLHVMDPHVALLVQRASRMGICQAKVLFGHATEEPLESLVSLDFVQHLAPWHQTEAESVLGFREGWSTIPNFVDTEQFRPIRNSAFRREWSIPDDGVVVTVCSAIKREHKRLDYLIEEFRSFQEHRPNLPVWFVIAGGRSDESAELIEMGRMKLGDRVRFVSELSRDQMPDFHAAGDVFVHGSLFEMFGTVMAEATACGVPCITHDHPVMKWVVGPGGVSIDMSTEGNLAHALVRLLDQPNRLGELGIAAREYCRDRFDKEIVVDQTVSKYAAMVGRKVVAA